MPKSNFQDGILAVRQANPPRTERGTQQADASKLEREIDQLVYQLYGLSPTGMISHKGTMTEEEVKVVKGR